jgi:iron complex transport system substrate-binding protein
MPSAARCRSPQSPARAIMAFNYEEFTAIAGVEGWQRLVGMNRVVWEGWRPAIFSKYLPLIPKPRDAARHRQHR